ncbi:MAG: DUF4105 domain-containing protein [Longimicrobiaceae bacterium]
MTIPAGAGGYFSVRVPARLLLFLLLPLSSPAQEVIPESSGDALEVYLVTIGPGDEVWNKFGHNALRIVDTRRGTDLSYNYGIFDFAQPGFLTRFVLGEMWYSVASFPTGAMLEAYRRQNRDIWLQELRLAAGEKAALRGYLEWNVLPENQSYSYDYFLDNCSTRVRDALDIALDGSLRRTFEDLPAGTTYRSVSRRLTGDELLYSTGVHAGLGPFTDRPLSAWDEMFIPMELRGHLNTLAEETRRRGGEPLVARDTLLFDATRPPPPERPPRRLAGFLLAGLSLGVGMAVLGWFAPASTPARVGFTVLGGGWGGVAGAVGVLLLFLWLFTDHQAAHRNENLLHLNPLSLPLLPLLPLAAAGQGWAGRLAVLCAAGAAGLSLLGLLVGWLPGLPQVNGEILALALPLNFGALAGAVFLQRKPLWTSRNRKRWIK